VAEACDRLLSQQAVHHLLKQYYGHVTSFGMAGVWFKMQEGVKEPVKEQVGVWAMYPVQRKSAIVNRPANRAETGENGQSSGWNMYEL